MVITFDRNMHGTKMGSKETDGLQDCGEVGKTAMYSLSSRAPWCRSSSMAAATQLWMVGKRFGIGLHLGLGTHVLWDVY